MLNRIRKIVQENPVKVRGVVTAALFLVGMAFPALAGIEANEAVVGVVVAGLSYLLSVDASRRVQLRPAERGPAGDAGEPDGGLEDVSQ